MAMKSMNNSTECLHNHRCNVCSYKRAPHTIHSHGLHVQTCTQSIEYHTLQTHRTPTGRNTTGTKGTTIIHNT